MPGPSGTLEPLDLLQTVQKRLPESLSGAAHPSPDRDTRTVNVPGKGSSFGRLTTADKDPRALIALDAAHVVQINPRSGDTVRHSPARIAICQRQIPGHDDPQEALEVECSPHRSGDSSYTPLRVLSIDTLVDYAPPGESCQTTPVPWGEFEDVHILRRHLLWQLRLGNVELPSAETACPTIRHCEDHRVGVPVHGKAVEKAQRIGKVLKRLK